MCVRSLIVYFYINSIAIVFVNLVTHSIFNGYSSSLVFVSGFNVDTEMPLIHRGAPGTYFGFSVSQHKDGRTSWLLVGAPLAQTDQPGVLRGGAVYKCSADSSNACQQIPFDLTGSSHITMGPKREQVDEKNFQWFGSTVESSGKTGMILACAPRYVYFSTTRKRREPVGTCYLSRGSFTGFLEYSPCRTDKSWGYHRQGSCQAGFSASLSRDGRRAYIGAPGSYYWQGQVFSKDLVMIPTLTNASEAPLASPESPDTYDDTYLGYTMTIGRFSEVIPGNRDDVDVAVGMPKGENLTGKVVLYTPNMVNLLNISGEQFGSYFGHSLTTGDFNGDGLDDIAIGAPLYSGYTNKDMYEQGRVYIAYQDAKHNFNIKTRITGSRSKARFGFSMSALGDINKDGIEDLVVGAPYDGENGNGIVYIFNGGKNGLSETASQVIHAELLNDPGLKTFGFSLRGGLDLDNNEYSDLLIGSYASDRAIQLKGRPVVNVTASLKVDPENINLEDKGCTLSDNSSVPCVIISLCMQYSGIGVHWELNFTYDIKLDMGTNRPPRLFLLYNEGRNEDRMIATLKKDQRFCRSIYGYLSSNLRDKLTPIKVEVDYQLFDPYPPGLPYHRSTPLKPILNKANKNQLSKMLHIEKNCGKDNKCIPDLRLTARTNMDQYLIGSRTRLELDVTVKNAGEDAFEAMFYLYMPLGINYVNINKKKLDGPVICTGAQPEKTGMNVLACDIGNPLPANKRINFAIILEPSQVITAAPDFTFITNVNSSNPEENDTMENNEVVIGIPIRVEVNITSTGISTPELVIYNISEPVVSAKSNELDIGPQVVHVYQLQNRGPSTIKQAHVTILWPSTTPDNQYLLYLLDQPMITGRAASCQTITLDEVNPLRLPLLKDQSSQYRVSSSHLMSSDQPLLISQRDNSDVSRNHSKTIVRRHNHHLDAHGQLQHTYPHTSHSSGRAGPPSFLDPLWEEYTSCGPRMCTKIYCTVDDLLKGETVLFSIRSRLWKETVVDIDSPQFDISSKMVTLVSHLPYDVDPSYLAPDVAIVTTRVMVSGLESPGPIPLWIILLGVIGGLILLSLLTLCFYRCGFFERKRPPLITSEDEPLHHPRNGYHYSKGDTSL